MGFKTNIYKLARPLIPKFILTRFEKTKAAQPKVVTEKAPKPAISLPNISPLRYIKKVSPFPKPFALTAENLENFLDFVRKKGEVDRTFVFDMKDCRLALDGDRETKHREIAKDVWKGMFKWGKVTGGRLLFRHDPELGYLEIKIYKHSEVFNGISLGELETNRQLVKKHLQDLLKDLNAEFKDVQNHAIIGGLVFLVIPPQSK